MADLFDLIAAIASLVVDLVIAFLQAVIHAMGTACLLLMTLFSRRKRQQFLEDWRSASTRSRTAVVAEAVGSTALLALFAWLGLWLADAARQPQQEVAKERRIQWDVHDPQAKPWADRADDEPLLEVELTAQPAAAEEDAAAPQPERKLRFGITRRDVQRVTKTKTIPELTEAATGVLQEKVQELRKKADEARRDERPAVEGKQKAGGN